MDNRINQIRKQIRALRVSMLEAEAVMREQINRDEPCSFVAEEILKMRVVMSLLVEERSLLGDREPILVNSFVIPHRRPAVKPAAVVKRQSVPAEKHFRSAADIGSARNGRSQRVARMPRPMINSAVSIHRS
jgi:hypothetical protein